MGRIRPLPQFQMLATRKRSNLFPAFAKNRQKVSYLFGIKCHFDNAKYHSRMLDARCWLASNYENQSESYHQCRG